MTTGRAYHTATLLPNGKVLVAGGLDSGWNVTTSAELYDPATGTWTATGSMTTARYLHTATLLPNGKVLVAGGYNGSILSSAELYDPATGTWTTNGAMTTAREYHTATLLPNGKVLVAGGYNSGGSLSSMELYDQATGTWTATSAMSTACEYDTATLLPNGKVLVAGFFSYLGLFDPATGTWTPCWGGYIIGNPATLLPNGKVLFAANWDYFGGPCLAWLYDPATDTMTTPVAMTTEHRWPTATLLLNGKVLVAGGGDSNWLALSSAEVYDIGLGFTNSWQPQIATVTSPLSLGSSLVVTGAQFRGVSEGSSGNSQDSSADYPLVQLRRLDNEQTVFLLTTNWSTNSFTSLPVWNFPSGYALATVFVNGIPSTSSVVNISVPVPVTTALTSAQKLTNGSFQFAFTNSVGALFGVLATTNLLLPTTNWTALGGVVELSPGQFQFTDSQATNDPQRFYLIRSP